MEETGPNLFQMMENAGRNLAEMTLECLGANWGQARIVVLAGTGGNGGGGIMAARRLANHGASVELCLAAPDRLSEVPAWKYKAFQSTDGKEVSPQGLDEETSAFILDTLIGYSLQSAPRGVFADLIAWANCTGAPILSLDVPSGIDSMTGDTPGKFIRSTWTMTLALPKTGLASCNAGQITLADIGIPEETYRRVGLASTGSSSAVTRVGHPPSVGALQTWGTPLISQTKAKVFPSGEKVGEPHRPMRAINVTTLVNSSVVAGVSAVTAPKPKSSVTEIVRARMSILRCENVDPLSAPADKVAYAQPAIHFFSRIRRHRLSLLLRPSPR